MAKRQEFATAEVQVAVPLAETKVRCMLCKAEATVVVEDRRRPHLDHKVCYHHARQIEREQIRSLSEECYCSPPRFAFLSL